MKGAYESKKDVCIVTISNVTFRCNVIEYARCVLILRWPLIIALIMEAVSTFEKTVCIN